MDLPGEPESWHLGWEWDRTNHRDTQVTLACQILFVPQCPNLLCLKKWLRGSGDGSVGKAYHASFGTWNLILSIYVKSQVLWLRPVIPAPGKWKQESPWGFLSSQSSQLINSRFGVRVPVLKIKVEKQLRKTPDFVLWPSHTPSHIHM